MSEPSVTVKGKEYFVGQVSVVLKLNSGPLIYLKLSEKLDGTEYNLSNEETFKKEFFQDIGQEEEGSFQWNGITIKFILVGYHSSEARTFELVGLVVKKELTDWFNENNFKSKPQDYFIYQKPKGKDSWIFFNKVLGDKFKQPSQDFIEKTKLLFPDNACIWRYKDSNNFHFLNRAIAFASRHLPSVQGWGAFDSDKPLRLILFEEQKQDQTIPQLDDTWNPSYPFLPNRYSWNRWLDSSCTLSRDLSIKEGQEMALIKELVTDGDNGENPQKGQNFQSQNPTRLLYVPGTINLGKKNLLCKAITYEFKLPGFGEELPSITMKLDIEYPERQIGDNEIVTLRLSGKFQAWEQEKEEETKIKITPSDDEKWSIIDEQDQTVKSGADAVLYTHILSRTYSDQKFSGIYIKHEKDDEMVLEIHPCDIPLVLGSLQKYHQKLEEADVTFSGKKLAISISPHSQKIDDSEAIILDNSQIKLNHGKQIFGQAMNKVDFLSQTVEIGSLQIEINSAQTKINSLVNVSYPSSKTPQPIFVSIAPDAGSFNGSYPSSKTPQPIVVSIAPDAGSFNGSYPSSKTPQPIFASIAPDAGSFMDKNDPFLQNASKRADVNPNGFFDVIAHGTPDGIEITDANGNKHLANHREAAKLIQQLPGYKKGQNIRLLSCSTGASDTGFAQNLANKLNVQVKAPTDLLLAYSDGTLIIAPKGEDGLPDLSKPGKMKTFSPKKPNKPVA